MKVYQSTGIEIDDRRNVMESWIGTAERGLRQMVNFAKDLPGFRSLALPDQIILLKSESKVTYFLQWLQACGQAVNGLLEFG